MSGGSAVALRKAAATAVAQSRRALSDFLATGHQVSFEAAIDAVDAILRPLNGIEGRAQLMTKVHPDAEVRAAALEAEQTLADWNTDLSLSRELYDGLVALRDGDPGHGDASRLLALALRSLRRAGVDGDAATRDRIRELRHELLRTGQEFDRNIINGDRRVVVETGHRGLAGLPADFLAAHPEATDGSVTLSTDPQERAVVLAYADDPALRRAYWLAVMNRAAPENLDVLTRLRRKRHELARLLGHSSWADYITGDKMLASAGAVRRFVESVADRCRQQAEADYGELLAEKQRHDPAATAVHEWDRAWLAERIRSRRFAFDSRQVRAWFPYDRVRDGVLRTSAALYGVEFRPNDAAERWHESVECYDVVEGGRTVARFWLDMHPRADKFKHAAMFDLTTGVDPDVLPEACLVCNLPRPTSHDPGLLVRGDVRTFFHEFGHLLHHLFSRQRFVRLSGITCEWDFVEVPSQLYEEWSWDHDVLAGFARHHATDQSIPRPTVEGLRRAEEHGKGLHTLTQAYYALLSLGFYDRDPDAVDPLAEMAELRRRLLPFPPEEAACFVASFGHLQGYSAMYYSYLWSLVISKDVFSRFAGRLMDTATARDFRAKVLARGCAADAQTMLRDFLGRDWSLAAFERWLAS